MKGVCAAFVTLVACVGSMRVVAYRLDEMNYLPRGETAYRLRMGLQRPKYDIVDDTIVATLEGVRQLMLKGIPEAQVPVLDPLTVPHYDLNINNDLADISVSLDNFVIDNLSSYKLERITDDLENLKIDFTLSFKPISLSGYYNITGKAGSIDIFGNGPFSLQLGGLVVDCDLHLTSTTGDRDGSAMLGSLDVHISIGAMKAKFENLMGGGTMGDLVNELISEVGPDFIEGNSQEVSIIIGRELQNLINPILNQYTLGQIVDQLESLSQ